MKATITGDFHLKTTDKYGKILPNGFNSRLEDKLIHIKKSVDHTIENKIPYWICDGDVFDKLNPPEVLRKAFFEIILPLIEHGIIIYIIIGNHDTDFKIHSFMADEELLKTFKGNTITIVSKPMEITLGGVDFLFIPFDTDDAVTAQLKKAAGKIVVGHFGIDGAAVSGTEYILSKGIKQKVLEIPRYTYAGHYHKPQTGKKWMYVGSISKVDFGERNDKKGFVVIEASPTTLVHTFIDVKDRIFFQHEVIESEDPDFSILSTWTNIKGWVIKLNFIGEETWYLRFNMGEIRSKILKEMGASKLFIDHRTILENRIRVPEINASTSWDEGIEVYCKKMKSPDMVDLGKSILQEAL